MIIVEDITNAYNVCVANDYGKAIKLAREYVANMFSDYDKASYQDKSHYHKDIRTHNLIGISISDVDYNKIGECRTNYFFGHITRKGIIRNRGELK